MASVKEKKKTGSNFTAVVTYIDVNISDINSVSFKLTLGFSTNIINYKHVLIQSFQQVCIGFYIVQ